MRKIILATALTLMCSSAFAQTSTGPAPQGDNMTKPGMSNDTMDKGSMDKGSMNNGSMNNTTGMGKDKDGMKKDSMHKDGMKKGRHVQVRQFLEVSLWLREGRVPKGRGFFRT